MFFILCFVMVFLHGTGDGVRLCGAWENFMLASAYSNKKDRVMAGDASMPSCSSGLSADISEAGKLPRPADLGGC